MNRDQLERCYPIDAGNGLHISKPKVMRSGAGYYIGRGCWDEELGFEEPYMRESDYFRTESEAIQALKTFEFRWRDAIENERAYEEHPELGKKPGWVTMKRRSR